MKKKDIIIINHDPLVRRVYEIFHIEDLINNGFNVKYIDLSQLCFPGIEMIDELCFDFVIKMQNIRELEAFLNEIDKKSTLFIVEAFFRWKTRRLFRILKKENCFVVKISLYANNNINKSLIERLRAITFPQLVFGLFSRIYFHFFRLKLYDVIFTSYSLVQNRISINHPDYEKYRDLVIDKSDGKFIVFLDEYFPLHPELIYWQKIGFNDPKPYQSKLNSFFNSIEREWNLPVIIAAHPKSNYKTGEFGSREIIKGQTEKLVKQSAFVILHLSSSVSYAILADKPIVFISTDEYVKYNKKITLSYQRKLAEILNQKIYLIDSDNRNEIIVAKIPDKCRQEYIYKYLTSKTTVNKRNVDIFCDYFNSFFNEKHSDNTSRRNR